MISYERAKAESLGLDAKGGLMERAERVILLCVGLLFDVLLIPVLWMMLVLTSVTAVQRFVKVWRQAGRPPSRRIRHPPLAAPTPARRRASPAPVAAPAPQRRRRAARRTDGRRARHCDRHRRPATGRLPAAPRCWPEPVAVGRWRRAGASASVSALGMRSAAPVERHLQRVNPSAPGRPRCAGPCEAVRVLRPVLGESFRSDRARGRGVSDAWSRREGFEHVEGRSAAGKGVILALPHLGGWDLGRALAGRPGHP